MTHDPQTQVCCKVTKTHIHLISHRWTSECKYSHNCVLYKVYTRTHTHMHMYDVWYGARPQGVSHQECLGRMVWCQICVCVILRSTYRSSKSLSSRILWQSMLAISERGTVSEMSVIWASVSGLRCLLYSTTSLKQPKMQHHIHTRAMSHSLVLVLSLYILKHIKDVSSREDYKKE